MAFLPRYSVLHVQISSKRFCSILNNLVPCTDEHIFELVDILNVELSNAPVEQRPEAFDGIEVGGLMLATGEEKSAVPRTTYA